MSDGNIAPGSGAGPIQPQQFYVQTYAVGPFPDLTKIFRGILRAVVDGPPPPVPSWTYWYNLNLIGKDRLPAGKQSFELAPSQRPPEQVQLHAWSWRQVDKLGQDILPTGSQRYDLSPIYPPYINQLRTWFWQYNLNLIGKDQLPVGEISTALPPQPPIPIGLTWIASPAQPVAVAAVTFRGLWRSLPDQPAQQPILQSAFPNFLVLQPTVVTYIIRQSDWPLPFAPQQPAQSWTWQYNLNLIGKDQLPTGEQVSDLAPAQRPPEQIQLHTWQWSYNLNLIGRDRLPTGEQVYDRPQLPIPLAQTWLDLPKYSLIAKPFFQSDWPNPTQPYRLDQTWVRGYTLSLIGQDRLPNRQQDWPLPLIPQQPTLSWTDPAKIWLTAPVLNVTIGQYWDRPQLPVPPAQSWTASYNLNLIGQDRLPTGEQVTDLPPRDFARLLQAWISSVNLALTAPAVTPVTFRGHYRSLPEQPALALQTWAQSISLALTAAPVQRPFVQTDWPLTPAPQGAIQTWTNTIGLALLAAQKPFFQTDWPTPAPPARDPTLSTIAASYNKNLIGQDRLPFNQHDWPLSVAAPSIPLQVMVAGKPFFLVPPQPLPPGTKGIFYDRPQLRQGTSADLAWPAWRWPQITPPPVSAVVPLRTLMGTGV